MKGVVPVMGIVEKLQYCTGACAQLLGKRNGADQVKPKWYYISILLWRI